MYSNIFLSSWEKRNCSVPENFIYLPDMYLKLMLVLYPKPHSYLAKMTSVRQIIQDFQERTTPGHDISCFTFPLSHTYVIKMQHKITPC